MRVKLPNFLIVGAAKSGTTSIYNYLKQHPDIYLPENKEPRFFVSSEFKNMNPNDPLFKHASKVITFTLDDYLGLFLDVKDENAIGEASVQYLYFYDTAIPEIRKHLGDVRIVIILRNPVDRAFSAHAHLVRDKLESMSFEKCLKIEEQRIRTKWFPLHFYKDLGFYYKQVKAYLENFSRVRVYLYDELKSDSSIVVRDIYGFLGVDPSFVSANMNSKYNVSVVPKVKPLHSFLVNYDHTLKKFLRPLFLSTFGKRKTENLFNNFMTRNLRKQKINPVAKEYLIDLYRDDILMLEKLLKRDLSAWLK